MKFYKGLSVTLCAFLLGAVVKESQIQESTESTPRFIPQSRIPEYLRMDNPVMIKLQETLEELSQLEAERNELQSSYDKLLGDYNELVRKPVFNAQDVSVKSNAHIYQIEYALEGTELQSLARAFYNAEQRYNINAFFLMGLVAVESGWGTSDRAINDNNMSGYAVYNDSSVGKKFASKEESVLETARLIAEDYLPEGAKYHTGKSVYDINEMYSADPLWSDKIVRIANELSINAKMWGVIEYE